MTQQNRLWPIVTTVFFAIVAFILGRIIWPDLPDVIPPSSTQLPFLIGVAAIEAIAFGIGMSFLLFGWQYMRGRSIYEWLVFFSAFWTLVSWWPHDNLHRTMHMGDYGQLIRIEYGFHFTLIIAGVLIASYLWKLWSARQHVA
jgi:hypothetical protein